MLKISNNKRADERIYHERFNTLKTLHTPGIVRLMAYWLMGLMLLVLITLFLPWQQNIRAEGELTALTPKDRPQMVPSVIDGRVSHWYIREGDYVLEGDTILAIIEIKEKYFDPELMTRLKEQVDAKAENISSKRQKVEALEKQINAFYQALNAKLEQGRNKVVQKQLKVVSDSNAWEAAKVDNAIAIRQLKGYEALYDSGYISLVKLESIRSKMQSKSAKLVASKNKYDASINELSIAEINLNAIEAEALTKISKAESDRSNTLAEISDSKGSLAKLKNQYANISIRNEQHYIRAPQNGYIVKALKMGVGEPIKAGESIVSIMPDNPDFAVALYVKAMDVPLLDRGRHVRLQFDGWPALQFTGWPSVSVGTFGGKVEVIDKVSSGASKYRILVTPNPRSDDEQWPEELRLGSGVYGWVMLDEVPVWFELWRQLNGFPPTINRSLKKANKHSKVKVKKIK